MSTPLVSIVRADSYEPQIVRAALASLLAPWGSMAAFVARGDRVLLKPNFLAARKVESAVCTHPEVILAVAEAALDAGAASVAVGDSPGFGSCFGAASKLGLLEPLSERAIRLSAFDSPVEVQFREGLRYKRFEVARDVLEVDKVINLAKVKTHGQMLMTLGVKNTFGAVVGPRKASWHLEAGRDEEVFAAMLLDLHRFVRPVLTVADGITMMEGNGPGNGTPRPLGLLFASQEAPALDVAVCDVLNVPAAAVPTVRVAARVGLGPEGTGGMAFPRLAPADVRVEGIAHPRLSPVGDFLAPRAFIRLTRRLLEVRPTVEKKKCIGCGFCQAQCPAKAILMAAAGRDGKRARILYNLCIHCYCCQEICPEGAISPKRGLVRRLFARPVSPPA